jgi:hypothetical protein
MDTDRHTPYRGRSGELGNFTDALLDSGKAGKACAIWGDTGSEIKEVRLMWLWIKRYCQQRFGKYGSRYYAMRQVYGRCHAEMKKELGYE